MTYHRIDKGDGQKTEHDRNAMKLQIEDRGFYDHGTMRQMEIQVHQTGQPVRLQTTWAFWEIRP